MGGAPRGAAVRLRLVRAVRVYPANCARLFPHLFQWAEAFRVEAVPYDFNDALLRFTIPPPTQKFAVQSHLARSRGIEPP